jgi:hypothetical protein
MSAVLPWLFYFCYKFKNKKTVGEEILLGPPTFLAKVVKNFNKTKKITPG